MSLKRSSGSTPGVGSREAAIDDLSDVDTALLSGGDALTYQADNVVLGDPYDGAEPTETAYSEYSAGYLAPNAWEANAGLYSSSATFAGPASDEYWRCEFAAPVRLAKVMFDNNAYGITSVFIEYSDNGTDWTTIKTAGVSLIAAVTVDWSAESPPAALYWQLRIATTSNSKWNLDSVYFWYGNVVGTWLPVAPVTSLDDLTDVDLTTTAPTTADVLTYDGADWVPTRPYPDTWLDALFTRPSDETVHTDDDEFSGTSLGGSWTKLTTSGTFNTAVSRGVLSTGFYNQTANDCVAILKACPSSTDLTIDVAFRILGPVSDWLMLGPVYSRGVTDTDAVIWQMTHFEAGWMDLRSGTFTNISTDHNAPGTALTARFNGIVYQRFCYSQASGFRQQFSIDGVTFTAFGSGYTANPMGGVPTHMGVAFSSFGSATESRLAAIEYFRVTESDLSA